jgi:hypothetical protein
MTASQKACEDITSDFKLPESWRKDSRAAFQHIKRHQKGQPLTIHVVREAYALRALELVHDQCFEFTQAIIAFATTEVLHDYVRVGDLLWPNRLVVLRNAFSFCNDHFIRDSVDIDPATARFVKAVELLSVDDCGDKWPRIGALRPNLHNARRVLAWLDKCPQCLDEYLPIDTDDLVRVEELAEDYFETEPEEFADEGAPQ